MGKADTAENLVQQAEIVVDVAASMVGLAISGFALRFPRIFRLRPDKDAREIDTITNVETLFRRLESGRRFSVQTHTGAAPPA